MTFQDIKAVQNSQKNFSLPYSISDVEIVDNFVFVNDKIAYKVDGVSSEYDIANDIIIRDKNGVDIGVLLFLKNRDMDIALLSEYQFVSLLMDANSSNDITSANYKFSHDYAVIDRHYFLEYEYEYKISSPLWGKFNHPYAGININSQTPISKPFVIAESYKKFNHDYYYESAVRGIQHQSPFERFLKFYHLLELNFDYDVIRRIQNLNILTDSHLIGKLLREYEAKEFARLLYLFDTYCTDSNPIVQVLNQISTHIVVCKDILFVFGKKDTNPFKEDFNKFNNLATSIGGFSFTNFTAQIKNNASNADYLKFLGNFSLYLIYRIRCSIAHNKIGEYLITQRDLSFVSEIGEPLLVEILKQVFRY